MEHEMHPIFKSYRDHVAECITENKEVPTLSEFTGLIEPFREHEVEDVEIIEET